MTDRYNFLWSRKQSQPLERVQARTGSCRTQERKCGNETVFVENQRRAWLYARRNKRVLTGEGAPGPLRHGLPDMSPLLLPAADTERTRLPVTRGHLAAKVCEAYFH